MFIGLSSLDREYLENLLWIQRFRFIEAIFVPDSTVNVWPLKNERQKCSAVFSNNQVVIQVPSSAAPQTGGDAPN